MSQGEKSFLSLSLSLFLCFSALLFFFSLSLSLPLSFSLALSLSLSLSLFHPDQTERTQLANRCTRRSRRSNDAGAAAPSLTGFPQVSLLSISHLTTHFDMAMGQNPPSKHPIQSNH